MTRKHFEAIAITLGQQMRKHTPHGSEWLAVYAVAVDLTVDFKAANPRFARDHFLDFVLDVAEGRRDLDGKKVAA